MQPDNRSAPSSLETRDTLIDALGQILNGGVSTAFYALVGLSAVYAIAERAGVIGSHE